VIVANSVANCFTPGPARSGVFQFSLLSQQLGSQKKEQNMIFSFLSKGKIDPIDPQNSFSMPKQ
jgi:hypothetical protein